jgi:FkbM family methyltransferase
VFSWLRNWFRRPGAVSERLLSQVALRAGDLAIDCGASVGHYTARMAQPGVTVYAFEPNPFAFEKLRERFAGNPLVHCRQNAVLDHPGRVRLHMHRNAAQDPVYWSTGSSLLEFKSNVSKEDSVEVEAIDLAAFIAALPQPVKLLKIDVEGVECPLLNRLIDRGLAQGIERILVETHDHKVPQLAPETNALRERIRREGLTNISLDWE